MVSDRRGWSDLDELLELGAEVIEGNEEWLAKHRAAMDDGGRTGAPLARASSSAGSCAPSPRRACSLWGGSLVLTRRRRAGMAPGCETRIPPRPERRKLGILQTGRAGKFRVWVRFLNAGEAFGQSEFGSGPGWYWDVTNPDPGWIMSCTMGPYLTPEEAWDDAHCLREQE